MIPIWIIITVLLLGMALIVLECFIPGFGVAGILGGIFSLFAYAALIPYIGWYTGLVALGELAVVILCVLLFAKSAGKGKNPLILSARADKADGFTANDDNETLINKGGIAESDLRPAGIALIEQKRVDVVSDGEFIKKGSRITVTEVNGRQIKVKIAD